MAEVPAATTAVFKIDLARVLSNWHVLNRQVRPAFAAAVIKANAYGMGADEVGSVLARAGCRLFFVARLDEAVRLRQVLKPLNLTPQPMIAVLDGYVAGHAGDYQGHGLMPVISSIEQLREWVSENDPSLHHRAILHFDTGMNRIGLSLTDSAEVCLYSQSMLDPWWGLISHLANDEDPTDPWVILQKQRFDSLLPQIPHQRASLAASSGIGLGHGYHYDFVRPGLGLYGLYPIALEGKTLPLQPALSVYGRVMQCRTVDAGAAVGYGATEVMEDGGRVAVIGLGYADFFPRSLDLNQPLTVKLAGYQVRPIGRVSMDLMTLDISQVPPDRVKAGDWAEVVGDDNSVMAIATAASTSPYEVLTRLGSRAYRHRVQP
ncbi:MAG: alanine racemase [Candidatus Pacebacteria bacterium]|nr:alanine racemase [Candidatus Paceibacterota bacterium]